MRKADIIYLGLFLILTLVFIFSLTYIHEKGHVFAAGHYNLDFSIKEINYLPQKNIASWGNGAAIPNTLEDCNNFNLLPLESRKFILFSGVLANLIVFLIVSILDLLILILLVKKRSYQSNVLFFSLYFLLIVLFILIIGSINSNILLNNPKNDGHATFLNCKAIFNLK
jgi:hypothetical protein